MCVVTGPRIDLAITLIDRMKTLFADNRLVMFDKAIVTERQGQEMLNWSTSTMMARSMGIYVAWGDTSKFAIVITQKRNNKVKCSAQRALTNHR
jgi:hypothetical protein